MRRWLAAGFFVAALLVVDAGWGGGWAGGARAAEEAEKRIALVIGISAYDRAPELANPRNDARAMAQALGKLGFEVEEKYDLSIRDFAESLRAFGRRAGQADVAVVYYAGHGIQVAGVNYLIPSDAQLERERDLVYEALPLNLPLDELAQAHKIGILILDACRNNPFVDRLSRAGAAVRVQARPGFGRVDDTPSDTLVAMATRADTVAEDGNGEHSPYTAALLQHLKTPGLELGLFFRNVRDTVKQATDGRQEPFTYGTLGAAPFYFNPRPANRPPVVGELRGLEVLDRSEGEPLRIGPPVDPDGDPVIARVTGLPRGGGVRIGERSVLIGDYLTVEQLAAATFRPDATVIGDAGAFEFVAQDGRGGSARGVVAVTIKPSNRPPVVAGPATLKAAANPLRFEPPSDPDGDPLTVTVTQVPERGSLRHGANLIQRGDRLSPEVLAQLSYDPEREPPGPAGAFAVVVEDGRGGRTVAAVTVEITQTTVAATVEPDEAAWRRIRASSEAADFQAFQRLFPESGYVGLARERAEGHAAAPPSTKMANMAGGSGGSGGAPAPAAAGGGTANARAKPGEVATAPPPAPAPASSAPTSAASSSPPAPSPGAVPNGSARAPAGAGGFQDCPACPVMVRVPPGSFQMGSERGDPSERPPHHVAIAKPFALGAFEVTVGQWRTCVEEGGCSDMPRMSGTVTDATPIHNVHWLDANAYVAWLGRKTGQRYRLPSEAEWEYAARAGTSGPYWWAGEHDIPADCETCGTAGQAPAPGPIGRLKPSPFGLSGMNGGVAEWVADCWNKDYRGAPADGRAWTAGNCRKHVLRGGSWRDDLSQIAASSRNFYDADVRYPSNGFRVARDVN